MSSKTRVVHWLGTSGTGVYKYDPRSFSTQKFVPYKIAEDSAANDVRRFHKSAKGGIFVATAGGVFLLNDGEKFASVVPNLPADARWNFGRTMLDRQGDWWFGTEKGVYRFNAVERIEQLKTAQPKAIYNSASGLPSDNILSVF